MGAVRPRNLLLYLNVVRGDPAVGEAWQQYESFIGLCTKSSGVFGGISCTGSVHVATE